MAFKTTEGNWYSIIYFAFMFVVAVFGKQPFLEFMGLAIFFWILWVVVYAIFTTKIW